MKQYIKPSMEQLRAVCSKMTAVSIIEGGKADDSEVLTKENNAWDIWNE